jgi:hypothetical protein
MKSMFRLTSVISAIIAFLIAGVGYEPAGGFGVAGLPGAVSSGSGGGRSGRTPPKKSGRLGLFTASVSAGSSGVVAGLAFVVAGLPGVVSSGAGRGRFGREPPSTGMIGRSG